MCGRYVIKSSKKALREAFPDLELPEGELDARFNVAPSQQVLAVTSDAPSQARWLKWGLIPHWAKDPHIANKLVNARCEGIKEKPAYRAAFKHRRCAILADGFYEWAKVPRSKHKQPWFFTRKGEKPFAFAGLWELWRPPEGEPVQTCTIITAPANELVRTVHDRMPVMLAPEQLPLWLRQDLPDEEAMRLLAPFPADEMDARPVSPLVNSASHEGPECLAPPEPPGAPSQGSLF